MVKSLVCIARSCLNAGQDRSRKRDIAIAMPGPEPAKATAGPRALPFIWWFFDSVGPGFDAAVSHLRGNAAFPKGSTVIQDRDDRAIEHWGQFSRQPADVFAGPDVFAKRFKRRCFEPTRPWAVARRQVRSRRSIRLRSWPRSARHLTSGRSIATPGLGANATEVLMVSRLAAISSGRNYAKLSCGRRGDEPLRRGD